MIVTHTHTYTHTEREREREAETQAEGEVGREPDVGLDPGTPGSHPGPKAGAKPLSHPGIPTEIILKISYSKIICRDARGTQRWSICLHPRV